MHNTFIVELHSESISRGRRSVVAVELRRQQHALLVSRPPRGDRLPWRPIFFTFFSVAPFRFRRRRYFRSPSHGIFSLRVASARITYSVRDADRSYRASVHEGRRRPRGPYHLLLMRSLPVFVVPRGCIKRERETE